MAAGLKRRWVTAGDGSALFFLCARMWKKYTDDPSPPVTAEVGVVGGSVFLDVIVYLATRGMVLDWECLKAWYQAAVHMQAARASRKESAIKFDEHRDQAFQRESHGQCNFTCNLPVHCDEEHKKARGKTDPEGISHASFRIWGRAQS